MKGVLKRKVLLVESERIKVEMRKGLKICWRRRKRKLWWATSLPWHLTWDALQWIPWDTRPRSGTAELSLHCCQTTELCSTQSKKIWWGYWSGVEHLTPSPTCCCSGINNNQRQSHWKIIWLERTPESWNPHRPSENVQTIPPLSIWCR